ncbi:VOC family protein [Baekduia soli]|uniref:VOC family protein n=1 Tax=Baekduia soli TaxID=496014 RepID=A0A5B8TZJ0_9ACTN|nr:VOC family protein [Baekduia soli]QEC46138.1 VOC family protein [Baekduia soli]
MRRTITTLLMFEGRAEEAMLRYAEIFGDAAIEAIERYGPEGPGPEGTVVHATLRLGEQRVQCTDSPVAHAFTFTPATSLMVDCDSEAEVQRLFEALGQAGEVLMPLDAYPFSPRFGWVNDRFGVSWQLRFVPPA